MQIKDVEGQRSLKIEGRRSEDSVFVSGPRGFCIEVDKKAFLAMLSLEFGLVEPNAYLEGMTLVA